MPHLFQVSIGPVQSFIKGARRTRDLKFGSSFLSKISWEAVCIIRDTPDTKLIFPAIPLNLKKEDQIEGVSNKILAYLPSGVSCGELAIQIKERIDSRVKTIKEGAFRNIKVQFDHIGAEQQIADLVEYIWAAVEYDADSSEIPYHKARQKLEALMAARKNTRDFDRAQWASPQPKSSLDGLLESVISEDSYPPSWSKVEKAAGEQRERLKSAYLQKSEALRRNFDAGPHEKLSGVDLLKRLGPITNPTSSYPDEVADKFPSTSHMAALTFLHGLNKLPDEKQQEATLLYHNYLSQLDLIKSKIPFHPDILPEYYWQKPYWKDIFSLGKYDGALLYPERFPDVVGDGQIFQEAHEDFQKATTILNTLCEKVALYPNPYYALLMADG